MKKRYKLLKDLPDVKAGSIFTWNATENGFCCEKTGAWLGGHRLHLFTAGTVTGTPEWFKEDEPEPELLLTRSELIELGHIIHPTFNSNWITNIVDDYLKNKKPGIRKQKLYTMDDMIDFGRFIKTMIARPIRPVDAHVLDNWMQIAHPESCVK